MEFLPKMAFRTPQGDLWARHAHTMITPHPAGAPHHAARQPQPCLEVGDSCATHESLPILSHFTWQSSCLSSHAAVSVGITSTETAKAEGFAFPTNTGESRALVPTWLDRRPLWVWWMVSTAAAKCSFQPGVIILLLTETVGSVCKSAYMAMWLCPEPHKTL